MRIKLDIGKLTLSQTLAESIALQQRVNNLQLLPIELRHIEGLSGLPMHHRDPFDRLLIAQSIVEAMPKGRRTRCSTVMTRKFCAERCARGAALV